MELTNSLEEYLKTMYILKNTQRQIRVTDIAHRLNCSKPSVNRALKTLKEGGYVIYEPYGKIDITTKGISTVKPIMKRYDTILLFLTEVLEVEQEKAEKEAAKMKHAISEDTIEKLENYINKILDLSDLTCCYNNESEKCKDCVKRTAKKRLKKQIK